MIEILFSFTENYKLQKIISFIVIIYLGRDVVRVNYLLQIKTTFTVCILWSTLFDFHDIDPFIHHVPILYTRPIHSTTITLYLCIIQRYSNNFTEQRWDILYSKNERKLIFQFIIYHNIVRTNIYLDTLWSTNAVSVLTHSKPIQKCSNMFECIRRKEHRQHQYNNTKYILFIFSD